MLGLKTKMLGTGQNILNRILKNRITNDFRIKSLMKGFGVDEYGHRASIKDADLGYGWIHYSLIRTVKPKNILCIGSRYGYIPALLAQACKENGKGHVDFVDAGYGKDSPHHWTGVGYWSTPEGKDCFQKFGLERFISTFTMTTKAFLKKRRSRYGYIYIDGDHSYKGVKFDHSKFWPMLENHGIMAFHDIGVEGAKPEGTYGVKKLWEKISGKNSLEFLFDGSGLGIIQKR